MKEEKLKVFELDFGDTNVLTTNPKEILDWIDTEMDDMPDDGELNYKITIRRMTQRQINKLPDWA